MAIRHTSVMRTVTPEYAAKLRENHRFPHQRPIRSHHVQMLRDAYLNGTFDSGVQYRIAKHGSSTFLIDANHRMEMIRNLPAGTKIAMPETVSHCDSLVEVALLYSRIDRGMGRSLPDAMRALGVFNSDLTLTSTQMNSLLACSVLMEADGYLVRPNGASYKVKSAEHRWDVMAPWLGAGSKFFAALHQKTFNNGRFFTNRMITTIGLVTFEDAPELAQEFWSGMSRDSGLDANDPRKRCLEFLREHHRRSMHDVVRNSSGVKVTAEYKAHYVAAAWNLFVSGKKAQRITVEPERAMLDVHKTRFDRTPKPVDRRIPNRTKKLLGELDRMDEAAAAHA